MSNVTKPAPKGAVYVCGACGKTAKKLIDFKDVSCSLHGVLCDENSLEYKDGRVIKANPFKAPNTEPKEKV